jgi:hypothetical protein
MSHLLPRRALAAALASLPIGALGGAASAQAASAVSQGPSGANASVSCTPLPTGQIRCMMTLKGGGGLSGTVTMRITRGKLLVALGQGRVSDGKAALTMRVLHRMTQGQYTVAMVVTLNATKVLSLPAKGQVTQPGAGY